MLTYKKILCPTDLTEPSFWAVLKAAEIALDSLGELFLLHVTPRGEEDEADVSSIAEKFNNYLPQKIKMHALCRGGDPTAEILRLSAAEDIDLVVMTTTGTKGWRQFGLGSVADEIIRLAPCPVLTINGPAHRWKWQRMVGKYHHMLAPRSNEGYLTWEDTQPKMNHVSRCKRPEIKDEILALAESWR